MTPRLLLALTVVALAACGTSTADPKPVGLAVSVTNKFAVADGNSIVRVTVTGDIQYPLSLSTTRGHWLLPDGAAPVKSISLHNINQADLVACDYKLDASCAGVSALLASDATQDSGLANVTFTTY